MADGFDIGRTRMGFLTGPLPVPHGPLGQTHGGIVMRQELGLCLGEVGKPFGQHLRNVLVVVLSRAPK
jgi:hypothetical protein